MRKILPFLGLLILAGCGGSVSPEAHFKSLMASDISDVSCKKWDAPGFPNDAYECSYTRNGQQGTRLLLHTKETSNWWLK